MNKGTKILVAVAIVGVMAVGAFAAGVASYNNRVKLINIGAKTISGQQTVKWDSLTTLIDTAHAGLLVDSTQYILAFEGIAHMNPGVKLYLGCTRADSGNVDRSRDLDSAYIGVSAGLRGAIDVPFVWRAYCQSDSAHIDTFFFNAAVQGGSGNEAVAIRGLKITVTQLTQDR